MTESLQTALRVSSGWGDVQWSAVSSLLRGVYVSGRIAAPMQASILALAANTEAPQALRCLAFEILWSQVATPLEPLWKVVKTELSLGFGDDVALFTLSTLAAAPPATCAAMFATPEVERSMADVIAGDGAPHVRVAAVFAFSSMARTLFATAAAGKHLLPADSAAAASTVRARLLDKGMEVMKAVASCLDDAVIDVAGAAYAALRSMWEALPPLPHAADSASARQSNILHMPVSAKQLAPGASSIMQATALGALSAPHTCPPLIAAFRAAYGGILRELAKRLLPRMAHSFVRIPALRHRYRRHAVRFVTLLLAGVAAESDASSGGFEPSAAVRLDGVGPGAQPSVATLLTDWMSTLLLPGMAVPLPAGGIGSGSAVAALLGSSQAEAQDASGSEAVAVECARAFVQLALTFGPACTSATLTARIAHARAAVLDLQSVSTGGNALLPGTARDSAIATALGSIAAAGGLATHVTANLLSTSAAESGGADIDAPARAGDAFGSTWGGALWPLMGGDVAAAAASHVGAAVTALVNTRLPSLLSCIFSLLRRVSTASVAAAASPAVVVATGGMAAGGGGGATPLSDAASPGGVPGFTASGAPLNPNDPAVLAAAGATVSAGQGLGSGAGSAIKPDAALQRLLILAINAASIAPARQLLSLTPALLRECGRLADDLIDDVGVGATHSARRVALLLYTSTLAVHTTLMEVAPARRLDPYVSLSARGDTPGTAPGETPHNSTSGGKPSAVTPAASAHRRTASGAPLTTGVVGSMADAASRAGADGAGGSAAGGASASAASAANSHSLLLARIVHEAVRPLAAAYPDALTSPVSLLHQLSGSSASGDAHAAEVATTSTRFRCEVLGVVCQALSRFTPLSSIAARCADVARGCNAAHTATVAQRIEDAETLHTWLTVAHDTAAAALWLFEHRLTYGGIGIMAKDAATTTLARIMGQPDAPALAPAPVPHTPPTSMYADEGGAGGALPGTSTSSAVDAPASAVGGTRTSVSGAGSSAGVGYITGWAWMREYEACVEASDALMNVITSSAALLHPPPLPANYASIGASASSHTAPGASLASALALDVLPPALLALHRTRLARLLYALSKTDAGIYRMYELERAALATAPKVAAAAAALTTTQHLTSSASRGAQVDVLPSALPLQLRILWLLSAVWDGTDGVTASATSVAGVMVGKPGGSSASSVSAAPGAMALSGTSAGALSLLTASATDALLRHTAMAPSSLQAALREVMTKNAGAMRAAGVAGTALVSPSRPRSGDANKSFHELRGGGGASNLAMSLTADETAALGMEALRQKRLAMLVGVIAGEAGIALGLGTDLEAAGTKAVTLANSVASSASGTEAGTAASGSMEGGSRGGAAASGVPAPHAFTPSLSAMARTMSPYEPSGVSSPTPPTGSTSSSSSSWIRESKLGRALGRFSSSASSAQSRAVSSVLSSVPFVYTGENTVVTLAYFWLLLDMLAHLASAQRCCAGQVKRAVECMLVQPKLAADVSDTLLALLPRCSLYAAAYGQSTVARELTSWAPPELLASLESAGALTPAAPLRGGGSTSGGGSGSAALGSRLGACGASLRTTTSSAAILTAVATEAALCARAPWSFSHYDAKRTIALDGTLKDTSHDPIVAYMLAQLKQFKSLLPMSGGSTSTAGGSPASGSAAGGARKRGSGGGSSDAADAPSVEPQPSPLSITADAYTPLTLALIAAAATPDLTQNATMGLNRSTVTGARMRTVPPIASAHARDVLAACADVALHRGAAGRAVGAHASSMYGTPASPMLVSPSSSGSAGGGSAAATLPCEYIGSVPRDVPKALDDVQRQLRDMEAHASNLLPTRVAASTAFAPTPLQRSRRLLHTFIEPSVSCFDVVPAAQGSAGASTLASGDALAARCASTPAAAFTLQPLSTVATSLWSPSVGALLAASLDGGAAEAGVVITSSCDPLSISVRHTPLPNASRVLLHMVCTNNTRLRLPAGTIFSVQVGGSLQFERGGVTSANVSSAQLRLGSSAMGNTPAPLTGANAVGVAMGAANAGAALAGDWLTFQRGSLSHATFTTVRSIPPGCELTFDVSLCVLGFASASVRCNVSWDCAEALPLAPDEEEAEDAGAASDHTQALIRAGRAVGAYESVEDVDDDSLDDDVDWSRAGASAGGATGAWASELANVSTCYVAAGVPSVSDGLMWTGPDLNALKKGRMLPATAAPTLVMTRASANRFLAAAGGGGGGGAGGSGGGGVLSAVRRGTSNDIVMREWAARDSASVSGGSGITPSRPRDRLSMGLYGSASVAGSHAGGGEAGDSASAAGDDDNASVGSGSTSGGGGGGMNAAIAAAGGMEGDDEVQSAGEVTLNYVCRPYRVRRAQFTTGVYRIPSWTLALLPCEVRLPPALSFALMVGANVMPGAASAFGYAGEPNPLAAASIEGGGLVSASFASGASATGSIVSIANAPFACTFSRLPYTHYGIACSRPIAMGAPGAASSLPHMSMTSPAWVAAVFTEGCGSAWCRLPLPLCPGIPPALLAQYGALDVAQLAFTSRTWGGTQVALFVTAILLPCASDGTVLPYAAGSTGVGVGLAPSRFAVWQASFNFRCDDARVRAALAAEAPECVHSLTAGRFVVISHGHCPSSLSSLQRFDLLIQRVAEAEDAAAVEVMRGASAGGTGKGIDRTPGAQVSLALASTSVDAKLRASNLTLPGVAGVVAAVEARSAGAFAATLHGSVYGESVFTLLPADVLACLQSYGGADELTEDARELSSLMEAAPAAASISAAAPVTVSLTDFFSAGVAPAAPTAGTPLPMAASVRAAPVRAAPAPTPAPAPASIDDAYLALFGGTGGTFSTPAPAPAASLPPNFDPFA